MSDQIITMEPDTFAKMVQEAGERVAAQNQAKEFSVKLDLSFKLPEIEQLPASEWKSVIIHKALVDFRAYLTTELDAWFDNECKGLCKSEAPGAVLGTVSGGLVDMTKIQSVII